MSKKITISKNQLKCLDFLAKNSDDESCWYFRGIAKEVKLPEKKVRIYVRALVRKGLAVYVRGLVDYDGFLAGSGHMVTEKGKEFILGKCKKCNIHTAEDEDGLCKNCW